MFMIIFLKVPSERNGVGASFCNKPNISQCLIKNLLAKQKNRPKFYKINLISLASLYSWRERYWKIPSWASCQSRSSCVKAVKQATYKKFFSPQQSWSCPQAYCCCVRRQKSPLDGITNFLSKSWHQITIVSFCQLSFLYWLGSSQTSINTSKWALT